MENKEKLQVNNSNLRERVLQTIQNLPGGVSYTGDNPLTVGSEGYTIPANTLIEEALELVSKGFPLELLGCSKYAVDNLTPTQDIMNTAFNHSLGVVPKYVFIYSLSSFSTSTSRMYVIELMSGPTGGSMRYKNYNGENTQTASVSKTSTTLKLSTGVLHAGTPYQIVTMGGG